MLAKYVEARLSRYMEFGELEDGRVDVASLDYDTLVQKVSRRDAKRLIEDRDYALDVLCAMAAKFDEVAPEAFSDFWYNKNGYPKDKRGDRVSDPLQ
jgi:hypothetical protein